jgi:hypothetical protein
MTLQRTIRLFCLCLAASSCGGREEPLPCDFEALRPPVESCNHFPNDSGFQGICAVDCEGNVFQAAEGGLTSLPDGRFFGVLFSPRPGSAAALSPTRVEAFAGANNLCNPIDRFPESNARNAVPTRGELTGSGDLFVRVDRQLRGPVQLVVILGMGESQYHWRSYVGGEPLPPCPGPLAGL